MPITRRKQQKPEAFVAYYRVSTARQGESKLGLEAQRETILRFAKDIPIVAEYIEVESGKSHVNRPQLRAAVADCKRRKATLVTAKLDRLARNVAFVANLMESGVDFVAADFPQANRLTIHILAAMAEYERELISQRTKAGLEQAKRRGVRMGNPRWRSALERAWAARRKAKPAADLAAIVRQYRGDGKSYRQIAATLNELGLKTPAGGTRWYAASVRKVLVEIARVQ